MATGYKKAGGTDLDAVYMAYVSGTKAALTGYKNSAGTDLRDLFQPYTQGAAPANVGYKISGGADLSTLFQDINVPLFTITSASYTELRFDATAPRMDFYVNGTVTNASGSSQGNWGTPTTAGAGSSYDIYVQVDTGNGTVGGSPRNEWLNLGTDRGWSMSAAPNGQSRELFLTYFIRPAGGGANLGTGQIELSSDRT